MDELKSIISEYLEPSEKSKLQSITDNSSFTEDIHMDSIDMVDVVIRVENKYGIAIKNETIPQLNTVGKCLDAIQEKLAEKGK